jgi:uncharacterized RDD family membrane protein YckC
VQWNDNLEIETPELVDVSLELAGLGSRFVARLIDWIIKAIVLVVLFLVVVVVAVVINSVLSPQSDTVQTYLATLLIAVAYAFFLGYDIYFEVRHNGQTPGKKRAGIRALREGGAPLDLRAGCVRNLLRLADLLPVLYLVGGVLVLLTTRKQRLGDLAAGTIVIRERVLEAPPDLVQEIERLASVEIQFTAEQLGPCLADGRQILREFFVRYEKLAPDPRRQLTCRLAGEFLNKTAYRATSSVTEPQRALTFLASLYRDLEKLKKHGR